MNILNWQGRINLALSPASRFSSGSLGRNDATARGGLYFESSKSLQPELNGTSLAVQFGNVGYHIASLASCLDVNNGCGDSKGSIYKKRPDLICHEHKLKTGSVINYQAQGNL